MFTPEELQEWWRKQLGMKDVAIIISNLQSIRNWFNILSENTHRFAKQHEGIHIGDSASELSKHTWALSMDIAGLCREMETFLHYITDFELGIQPDDTYNNNDNSNSLENKEQDK